MFVESNFVLELALLQEQSASCDQMVVWAESGDVDLVVPSYALVEPFETLRRRHSERARLAQATEQELKLLSRSLTFAQEVASVLKATGLLIQSTTLEDARLQTVQYRLVSAGRVLPLTEDTITAASAIRQRLSLSGPDSLIYAAILGDLGPEPHARSCFLTRNSKDFKDPEIVDELAHFSCTLISNFEDGRRFVASQLG